MSRESPQTNVRLSDAGRRILADLLRHFTPDPETGQPATPLTVIERALRCLARREKILKKIADSP